MIRKLLIGAKQFGAGNMLEQYQFLWDSNGLWQAETFQTDLILTALTVSWGWVAFGLVVMVLLFFTVKGLVLCFKQKNCLGLFISLSVVLTFSMQAAVYVLYNLGFQLFSPISLPLISHGNTAMLINLALIGFMLSVFRTGSIVEDKIAVKKPVKF